VGAAGASFCFLVGVPFLIGAFYFTLTSIFGPTDNAAADRVTAVTLLFITLPPLVLGAGFGAYAAFEMFTPPSPPLGRRTAHRVTVVEPNGSARTFAADERGEIE
jgi:hypothetical protein